MYGPEMRSHFNAVPLKYTEHNPMKVLSLSNACSFTLSELIKPIKYATISQITMRVALANVKDK